MLCPCPNCRQLTDADEATVAVVLCNDTQRQFIRHLTQQERGRKFIRVVTMDAVHGTTQHDQPMTSYVAVDEDTRLGLPIAHVLLSQCKRSAKAGTLTTPENFINAYEGDGAAGNTLLCDAAASTQAIYWFMETFEKEHDVTWKYLLGRCRCWVAVAHSAVRE
jgi:hypothetical protein